jgi:hypothetical protein
MNPTHLLCKLLFVAFLLCTVKQTPAQCIDFPESANLSLNTVTPSCQLNDGKVSVQCNLAFKQRHLFSINGKDYSSVTSFTDLRADSYIIYAKDKSDTALVYCRQVELKEPAKLNISISKQKDETCFNKKDCEIAYTIGGGTPPYSVRLINSDKIIVGTHLINEPGFDQFTGLRPASYRLEVKDAKGCEEYSDMHLQKAEPLIWNEPIITNESDLDKKDGRAIINVTGGNSPFTYTLKSNDSVIYKKQNNLISGLSLGSYDIIIEDRSGCELKQSLKIGSEVDLSTQNLQSKSKERLVYAETLLRNNKTELKSKKNKYNLARFSTQGVALVGGVLSLLVPDQNKGIVAGISAGSTAVLDLFTDMVKLEEEIEARKSINTKLNNQISAFKKAWPPEKMNKPEFSTEEYKKFILDMQLLAAVIAECEVLYENIEQQSK